MEKEMFSPMAIDALGEMMNISLGSSATAVSNMLDHRVDITTPTVSVVDVKDFSLGNLEPAIGVALHVLDLHADGRFQIAQGEILHIHPKRISK